MCASSILNRMEGHFKVVLAFKGRLERQIRESCVHELQNFKKYYQEIKMLIYFYVRKQWSFKADSWQRIPQRKHAGIFICHTLPINFNTSQWMHQNKVLSMLMHVCYCTLWLLWSNAQSAEAPIQRISISLLSREFSNTFKALPGSKRWIRGFHDL